MSARRTRFEPETILCTHCGVAHGCVVIVVGTAGGTRVWGSDACALADGYPWLSAPDPSEQCRCVRWRAGKPCCAHRAKRGRRATHAPVPAELDRTGRAL